MELAARSGANVVGESNSEDLAEKTKVRTKKARVKRVLPGN